MKDSRFCYFSISFIAWVLEREQTEVPKRRMPCSGKGGGESYLPSGLPSIFVALGDIHLCRNKPKKRQAFWSFFFLKKKCVQLSAYEWFHRVAWAICLAMSCAETCCAHTTRAAEPLKRTQRLCGRGREARRQSFKKKS